jgi:hypothetical protein
LKVGRQAAWLAGRQKGERQREKEREGERRESSRLGNAALVGLTFPSLGSSPGSKREREIGEREGGKGGIRHSPWE